MTSQEEHQGWISRISLRGASGALVLAVALGLMVVVATHSAQAETFTVLYNFKGSSDGGDPVAGVIMDPNGNLYGDTSARGGNGCLTNGCGTLFKLSKSGKLTVLHSFAGSPSDGANPGASLLRDNAGNFYGTTDDGGEDSYGVVFELNKFGKERVLYSFVGGTTDGCLPEGNLVRDTAGSLYGTTSSCGASTEGTVFKLNTKGVLTLLHSFSGGPTDGAYPFSTGLLMDANGNLYGVTSGGGTSNNGVVYQLSKSGKLTVLHSFAGSPSDGCFPSGTPAMDKLGNLYGIAQQCGASGFGTVWKLSKDGTETVLHSFAGAPSDGLAPSGGVIIDPNGNLYGVTSGGGAQGGYGTIYELNKKGTLALLHSFDGKDGESPPGGLIRDTQGSLYGTAALLGRYRYGTVWKLIP